MESAPGAERLAMAHSEVKRACGLLIASTPEALQNCQTVLRQAVSDMVEFRAGANGSAPQELLKAFRSDVHRAGSLLRNLNDFYKGWERILGAMSGGYTANGDPAAVARQGRISCRG
jgi:hypothetical protein